MIGVPNDEQRVDRIVARQVHLDCQHVRVGAAAGRGRSDGNVANAHATVDSNVARLQRGTGEIVDEMDEQPALTFRLCRRVVVKHLQEVDAVECGSFQRVAAQSVAAGVNHALAPP